MDDVFRTLADPTRRLTMRFHVKMLRATGKPISEAA
jgi:hypothetical protein